MSRLDSFIRRVVAQRDCLNAAAQLVGSQPGVLLEVGLGNGRTYDHLRSLFPDRAIYVFDRAVVAHPDCIPPAEMLRLGDFRETLPRFLAEGPRAILVHADIGSGDKGASLALAQELAPTLAALILPGGCLVADQPMDAAGLAPLPPPEGAPPGRYYLYRRVG
jgi:hypothetical protein